MTIKEIKQHLRNILNTTERSADEKQAIEDAITILEKNRNKNRDQLISVAKILSDLITIGVKIFDS